jgi:dimethylhistidine N-methyltransferase
MRPRKAKRQTDRFSSERTTLVSPPDLAAAPDDRLVLYRLAGEDAHAGFARDVARGLSSEPKQLFPKYLYDELGSHLFEAICQLPEYYCTRAEAEILTKYADEIAGSVAGNKTLIEMGSGSASKSRLIIEALLRRQHQLVFIPVDISASALETSARSLLQTYPALRVIAYAGDYYDGIAALSALRTERALALFLGSNIGNFDAEEADKFLRAMRNVLRTGDALLLGADLKKDPQILEAAYNDALGVTSAFVHNQLVRINRELDADFDVRNFKLVSLYNRDEGRIEVYLESSSAQTVAIRKLEMVVDLQRGERIHMEHSYKYDLEQLSRMASETGFERTRTWTDAREFFSSNLFLAV